MKKFYVLLIGVLLLVFAGCTNTSDDDKTIKELEAKIVELQSQLNDLQSNVTENEEEIERLKKEIEELKSQLNLISYSIAVYDLDEECLGEVLINGKEDDVFFDILCSKFDVRYTNSEYGPLITSINNSIVDANYYLAIYENGEYATTGVDGLIVNDGDQFEFKVECWNTELDDIDRTIDQFIYSFMKKTVDKIYNNAKVYYDYTLTSAILMMANKGYDSNVFKFDFDNKDIIKETLETKDWSAETVQNNFMKGGITLIALNGDTTGLENALDNQLTYNYWQTIITEALSIENERINSAKASFEIPTVAGDASMMELMVLSLYKTKEELGDIALDATYAKLTPDGIDDWGVNSSSTAQFILIACALGKNPRDYQIDGGDGSLIDVVEILLKYRTEDGLCWKLDTPTVDYGFATPQGIATLMAYKALRDTSDEANIYKING